MEFWNNKKVVVTGGRGFLGSYVVDALKNKNCKEVISLSSKDCDLTDIEEVKRLYSTYNPEIVIHLAAAVGGIGANQAYPGSYFYKNITMGTQLMEQARLNNVEKFVNVGTICCYPKITTVPFKEENLWDGYPDEITGYYGMAKKMLLIQSDGYRKEYGFNSIFLMPTNLYGPRDNFKGEHAHVMPALINKFYDAKKNNLPNVICWGTGNATREFLHVKECAEGIILAAEKHNSSEPVNLGTGVETSIKYLSELIKDYIGYNGDIVWDTTRPDGQPRRCLDITKARERFGFVSNTTIENGLKETIEWYIKYRNETEG